MDYGLISFSVRLVIYFIVLKGIIQHLNKPSLLLLLGIFILPFGVSIQLPWFSISVSEVVFGIFVMIVFIKSSSTKDVTFGREIYLYFAVIAFGLIVSAIYANHIDLNERYFVSTAKILLYLFLVIAIIKTGKLYNENIVKSIIMKLCQGIYFVSIAGIVVFILSAIAGTDILPLERVHSLLTPGPAQSIPLVGTIFTRAHFLNEPKELASWACIGFMLTLYLFEVEHRDEKKLLWKYIIVNTLAVFLSFSRAGIIQIAFIIVLYFLFKVFLMTTSGRFKYSNLLIMIIGFSVLIISLDLSYDLEAGLMNTLEQASNLRMYLLEDYDYAVSSYYMSDTTSIILPKGIAYIEEMARPFLPDYAFWTHESLFSIRRGAILSLVEYGLIGSLIMYYLFIKIGVIFIKRKEYGSAFLLFAWLCLYLLQVEGSIISFHKIAFALFYLLLYPQKVRFEPEYTIQNRSIRLPQNGLKERVSMSPPISNFQGGGTL